MKIAIVDDVELYRENLKEYLRSCSVKYSLDIQIDCYEDGIEILDKKEVVYDLIYFDIKMNFVDGMEAAREIRNRDEYVIIIFCTNYVQYAIDGYSVGATDFLIKPVSEFAFMEHFKKILPKLKEKDEKYLIVRTKTGLKKIKYTKILYLESDGHYVNIICKNEKISFLSSLKKMDEELKEHGFYRCNSCYIVNLAYVEMVVDNIVTVSGHKLQYSRTRRKGFMEALTNYIGDEI